ncbi:hypothetical protein [Fulvivirga sp.]|uniref:hypothetical protein n=1 Tax=Fulvivirga sp. TaxID=1931237 RepID=UPI0032EF4E6C
MTEEQNDKKNRRTAAIASVTLHALLLVAFLFMLAWKEPDPPLPEYGIELNFGLDNVGSGEEQPEVEANDSQSQEEAAENELPEETVESTDDTQTEEVNEVAEPVVEETTVNEQASPDVVAKEVVKEEVKPVKETPKEVKKETTKPVEKTEVTKPEDGAKGKDGEATEQKAANHGDNTNKVGDKGHEEGTLDSRALYGQPGGGGGPALQIIGWIWDEVPNKKDKSSENGIVVIDFLIDQDGYVMKTTIRNSSVSMAIAKFYEDQLRDITFSKTNDGVVSSATTKGSVTFVIKSK